MSKLNQMCTIGDVYILFSSLDIYEDKMYTLQTPTLYLTV